MKEDNAIDASFAIIQKQEKGITSSVILIWKQCEVTILDYKELLKVNQDIHYLLLKFYEDEKSAYKDFMKLIGKMCKKKIDSKYFLFPKQEDNKIKFVTDEEEYILRGEEAIHYETRWKLFQSFILKATRAGNFTLPFNGSECQKK